MSESDVSMPSSENGSNDNFRTADDQLPSAFFELNYLNTNARSLRPKITSLIDAFENLDLTFAVITETWFTNGSKLQLESENRLLGHGLNNIVRNRPAGRAGFSHGGVAVIYNNSSASATTFNYPNPEQFEVLPCVLSLRGIKRKFVVIGVYIPPGYAVARGKACIQYVRDLILEIKNSIDSPYIGVFGDFNQWQIQQAFEDYPDIVENVGGFTRKDRVIDRNFCNWNKDITETKILAPLETEETEAGNLRRSDHNVVYMKASVKKLDSPNWQTFKYRPFSEEGARGFENWIAQVDWSDVLNANGSNDKARAFQAVLDEGMDFFFPEKTMRRKSNDLPWFNNVARKKVKKKKAVFKAESRSPRWKAVRDDLDRYLEKRRVKFLAKQRGNIADPQKCKHFFRNIKAYDSAEKPETFDVKSLKPDGSDSEIAEEIATYFNRISHEFQPLDPFQIPKTYDRQLPMLSVGEVATKLRTCKKPSSRVDGDIFPVLVKTCANSLAIPLANIFNTITLTSVWPISWKKEIVSAIPKKKIPQGYGDLRNISCTKLFSKVYESYVLGWAMEEITLKDNQFGGVKGCSTSHMLLSIWSEICENCEDYRSGTVLTAIDYAKAFNRVSFQECLKAFKAKGASNAIIKLLATFLTNRTMSVKVGSARSQPKDVNGGCPQGSILGVFIFNVTTDGLENKLLGIKEGASESSDSRTDPPKEAVTSSPASGASPPDWDLSPLGGGRYRVRDMELVFERGVKNAPGINYTDEGLVEIVPEIKVGTQVLTEKPIVIRKYVDDNVSIEKLNYGQTPIVVDPASGKPEKKRLAPVSQNAFRSITKEAEDKGMVVNSDKTQLLVISDALNYTARAFIADRHGNVIEDKESMKILGFEFGKKPTVALQVQTILNKFRRKYWSLRHLKKLGFNQEELVKVYRTVIRPAADYCDVVYHSMLNDEQDEALERAQIGALRTIFDYKLSARKLRELAGVTTLRERRVEHCDKFAQKCANSARFQHWFPLRPGRQGRQGEKYLEKYARCDRLKNSPLFFMRRRLNGKDGLTYGERNRFWREA